MTEDVRRLLGGYATGTLTETERKELFEAAIADQTLFEALADEQALKEVLEDPAARSQLLQTAATPRFTMRGVLRDWFERPKAKILVTLGGVALVAIAVTTVRERYDHVALVKAPESLQRRAEVQPLPYGSGSQGGAEVKGRGAEAPKRGAGGSAEMLPRSKNANRGSQVSLQRPEQSKDGAAGVSKGTDPIRVASAGSTELKYTVLRRDAGGEYEPVPAEYGFAAEDQVRLRVETNARGMLLIRSGESTTLYAGTVTPSSPVLVPAELTFMDAESREIRISFRPMPSSLAMKYSAGEREAAEAPPANPSSLDVELTLHRKKP